MTEKILILYASVDGQTLKISNFIADRLKENDKNVYLHDINKFKHELTDFDKIIVGSSIRYGVHHKAIIDFINQHKETLEAHNAAFFSVNLVARKPEKNQSDTNPYVIKFFKQISWRPSLVEVFAGKLDYEKYPFFDRIMIQFIMWMTKGPTDSKTKIEYTDWKRVSAFADKMISL